MTPLGAQNPGVWQPVISCELGNDKKTMKIVFGYPNREDPVTERLRKN